MAFILGSGRLAEGQGAVWLLLRRPLQKLAHIRARVRVGPPVAKGFQPVVTARCGGVAMRVDQKDIDALIILIQQEKST